MPPPFVLYCTLACLGPVLVQRTDSKVKWHYHGKCCQSGPAQEQMGDRKYQAAPSNLALNPNQIEMLMSMFEVFVCAIAPERLRTGPERTFQGNPDLSWTSCVAHYVRRDGVRICPGLPWISSGAGRGNTILAAGPAKCCAGSIRAASVGVGICPGLPRIGSGRSARIQYCLRDPQGTVFDHITFRVSMCQFTQDLLRMEMGLYPCGTSQGHQCTKYLLMTTNSILLRPGSSSAGPKSAKHAIYTRWTGSGHAGPACHR